jgi:ABC-2 type transport system ATP-binding protein
VLKKAMIEARHLNKSYRLRRQSIQVFQDLNFTLPTGKSLAIIGNNGSGKSTLIRLLAGLLLPNGGELLIDQKPAAQSCRLLPPGVLLEGERSLYWRLSVLNNLIFYAGILGSSAKMIERQIDLWQMRPHLHKRIDQLSSGLKKRVALMRAFLHAPSLLLLDEPSSALDEPALKTLEELIKQHRSNGGTLVISGVFTGAKAGSNPTAGNDPLIQGADQHLTLSTANVANH